MSDMRSGNLIKRRSCIVKLYLTGNQQSILDQQLGNARFTYNHFLALRQRHYKIYGKCEDFKSFSYNRMSKHLTKIKHRKSYKFLQTSFAWSLQTKLQDLDIAYQRFFKAKKGYPNFKSRYRGDDSMRFDRKHIHIKGNKIKIPKMGYVKFRGRLLDGELRNLTIKKTTFGRYTASIMYEVKAEDKELVNIIGIDMNCHNITTNTGEKYNIGSYFFQDKIKMWSRIMNRRVKGSNRRRKAKRMLAMWHRKAADKRNYLCQELTTKITQANKSQVVGVILEDLKLDNMTRKGGSRKRGLNRSMLDTSLGSIRNMLEYKTATYRVPPQYTSQECHQCGHRNSELNLSMRQWSCTECGAELDRDINAAINVKNKWLRNSLRGAASKTSKQELMHLPAGIWLGSENMESLALGVK